VRPVKLRRQGEDQLVIEWSDGHVSVYHWRTLRAACPCATCREEREKPVDPLRVLSAQEVAALAAGPPRALSMTPVGHYAYQIHWSDGHATGIYTFETLRNLCECDACRRLREQAR